MNPIAIHVIRTFNQNATFGLLLVHKTMKSSDLITFEYLNGCNESYDVCYYIVLGCVVFIVH